MKPAVSVGVASLALTVGLLAQSQLRLPPPVDSGPSFREILVPGNGQGFAGLASIDPQGAVIYYDSVWVNRLGGFGSDGFRFLRAHEYGHHRLGHTLEQYSTPPAFLPILSYRSELEADCWAVSALKRAGDTAAIRAGFDVYQTALPPFDLGNRPGGEARVRNMNSCSGERVVVGRSCQTPFGRCGPFVNQPAQPVGSTCYCVFPGGAANGTVVTP